MKELEAKFDSAVFSARRWFVDRQAFTTEEDAKAAIRLALGFAHEARRELGDQIGEAIERLLP